MTLWERLSAWFVGPPPKPPLPTYPELVPEFRIPEFIQRPPIVSAPVVEEAPAPRKRKATKRPAVKSKR